MYFCIVFWMKQIKAPISNDYKIIAKDFSGMYSRIEYKLKLKIIRTDSSKI